MLISMLRDAFLVGDAGVQGLVMRMGRLAKGEIWHYTIIR
jgi:hypothetical protein